MWVRNGWGHSDWRYESEEQECPSSCWSGKWGERSVVSILGVTAWISTQCATACPISSKQMRYNLHHGLTAPCIYLHSAIVYLYFNCLLTCQLPTRQSPLEDRESLFILHPPTLLSHEAIWEMYFWTNMLLTPSADSENMWEKPDNLKMWYSQESPNRYTETYLN